MTDPICYVNGHFVPTSNAFLHATDLGLLRGYGVFEYLRTYNRAPFHLEDHLQRLAFSAAEIGLRLSKTMNEIRALISLLLEKNAGGEFGIKIIATGGISQDQLLPADHSSLIILMVPHQVFPEAYYEKGIKAVSTKLARSFPTSKTLQYTPALVALQKGLKQQAHEAVFVNPRGEILEAATSNFFGFQNGVLKTADSDEILFGITREIVLRLAKPHFEISMDPISYDEIAQLDEAFVTSTNKEVLPIIQIDDLMIGSGNVGSRTRFIGDLFKQYVWQNDWTELQIERYKHVPRNYREPEESSLLSNF